MARDDDLEALKELLETRIDAMKELLEQRLTAAQRAVDKAEAANDYRFASVNAFREQLSDQAATFMFRTEYRTAHEALNNRLESIAARLDKTEGKSIGSNSALTFILGGIPVLVGIITVVLIILK